MKLPSHYTTSPPPRPTEQSATIEFGGHKLCLLPERALWCASEKALFVADLHVGKEASFRAAGLPVPDVFGSDLARLSNLIDRLAPASLYVLGDLLHDRTAHTPAVVRVFTEWRSTVAELDIHLIRGNHDRRAGDPPPEWRINCLREPASLGPMQLRHTPQFDDTEHTLAGHLHPKFRLSHGPDQLRLPCFLKRRTTLVLPAFADFIDHAVIANEPSDTIYIVAGSEVIQIRA